MFRRLNHCAVPGYAPLHMDTNDPFTIECAFKKRLLRDIPKADRAVLARFKSFVRDYVKTHIPRVEPLAFEEWLSSTTYNEERKSQLRHAYDELRGGLPSRKQASHIDTFVKSEFYTTWKHARMINSRSDAFKVWSGPRFKAIENAVYHTVPEFIKHVPVPERPALIAAMRKTGLRYFATDFTAFESHFTSEFLNICENALYRYCLQSDVDAEFLCQAIAGKNRMSTRTGVTAEVTGRRMSGDMCTSLGNGFTNLMLAKFIASEKGGSISGFVEGDDGLFATDVNLTAEDYAALGFTIKIEEIQDPCTALFCGMVFADSGEIVKDPRKFVMGFGWTQSFTSAGPRIMDELLRAKALSSVYETPQCPVIGAFARHALNVTKHVSPRFVDDGYHVPHDVKSIPAFKPSPDTRLLFESLYGISVPTQLLIEAAVSAGDFVRVSSLMPPTVEQLTFTEDYVVVT